MLRYRRLSLMLGLIVALSACQGTAQSRVVSLTTLNNSGVTGSATLTAVDDSHTQVDVEVNAAGHNDMPAHIHPGTCATFLPQPKYPLENVQFGHSITVVAASFSDLMQDGLAVNLHSSNEDMATYAACGEIR